MSAAQRLGNFLQLLTAGVFVLGLIIHHALVSRVTGVSGSSLEAEGHSGRSPCFLGGRDRTADLAELSAAFVTPFQERPRGRESSPRQQEPT